MYLLSLIENPSNFSIVCKNIVCHFFEQVLYVFVSSLTNCQVWVHPQCEEESRTLHKDKWVLSPNQKATVITARKCMHWDLSLPHSQGIYQDKLAGPKYVPFVWFLFACLPFWGPGPHPARQSLYQCMCFKLSDKSCLTTVPVHSMPLMSENPELGKRGVREENQILEAHWWTSLTKVMSIRFSEESCLKPQR